MSAPSPEHALHARLASHLESYHPFVQEVLERLEVCGWQRGELFAVHMALEESISNAIRHGNKFDDAKEVEVECVVSSARFWVRICDQGQGFQPEKVPDCRSLERLEVPGGRGLTLMKAYMDDVAYNACGNCLTMEKRRATGG